MKALASQALLMTESFIYQEPIKLNYTRDGVQRLASVIKASLNARGWSSNELGRQANISSPTAARYSSGTVVRPQDEILKAIAPYVYRLIAFKGNCIEIDTNATYEGNWQELAKVATDAFKPSIVKNRGANMDFAEMIEYAMREKNISQQELEISLKRKIDAGAFITLDRLREIQKGEGEKPLHSERMYISVILDQWKEMFSYEEWIGESENPIDNSLDCLQGNGSRIK